MSHSPSSTGRLSAASRQQVPPSKQVHSLDHNVPSPRDPDSLDHRSGFPTIPGQHVPPTSQNSHGGQLASSSTLPPAPPALQVRITLLDLPDEVVCTIIQALLLDSATLHALMRTCRRLTTLTAPFLYRRPCPQGYQGLRRLLDVLSTPPSLLLLPYATYPRRINLSEWASQVQDRDILGLRDCTRLQRITWTGCSSLTAPAIQSLLPSWPDLLTVDLSGVTCMDDPTLSLLARSCPQLQCLYLAHCDKLGEDAVLDLIISCPWLRRLKLSGCTKLTDSIPALLLSLQSRLIELDLSDLPLLGDPQWSPDLLSRALDRIQAMNPSGPSLDHFRQMSLSPSSSEKSTSDPAMGRLLMDTQSQSKSQTHPHPHPHLHPISNRPLQHLLEKRGRWLRELRLHTSPSPLIPEALLALPDAPSLRFVGLSSVPTLEDVHVIHLCARAPRICSLELGKCARLTDQVVTQGISRLGRGLQILYLGHCSSLTDGAVVHLVRACPRLRYVDFGGCALLTNRSLRVLGTLGRLRRLGVVRCSSITDEGLRDFTAGVASRTIERLHLSFCVQINIPGVLDLLNGCPRLNHVSVTGVPAFLRPDLQAHCRPPPTDLNAHQRLFFCVWSGDGVTSVRDYLNSWRTSGRPPSEDHGPPLVV